MSYGPLYVYNNKILIKRAFKEKQDALQRSEVKLSGKEIEKRF